MKPIDMLRSGEYKLKFGWLQKDWMGCIDWKDKTLVINIMSMLALTYVHEYTHAITGSRDEQRVNRLAKKCIKRMTKADIIELGREILTKMLEQGSITKKI